MKLITMICLTLHLYICWFEMFAWTTKGPRIFRQFPADLLSQPNRLPPIKGFLAAGLIWSMLIQDAKWQYNVVSFFLACVAIAGIFGAITASKRIYYIQALPSILALISISI